MGCCCGVEIYRRKYISGYNHYESDLVQVGEYNGNQFSNYYYDHKFEIIYLKKNNHYYTETILEIDGVKIILLMNDDLEYVFFNHDDTIEKMKRKYHEEIRNQIRDEVRQEFSKTELLTL